MATWWTLAVTPLSAGAESKTVVVRADNWLAALRAGRQELGESGGVPQGASCLVNDDGTVAILDGRARRRFVLSPSAEPSNVPASRPAPHALPPAAQAHPSARPLAPPAPASEPPLTLVEELPASDPPPPAAPAPAAPALRKGTMAYSPEESAAIRSQLLGSRELAVGKANAAPARPALSAGSYSTRPQAGPQRRSVVRPAPKKETMAYSPEESAAVRAQLARAGEAPPAAAASLKPSGAIKRRETGGGNEALPTRPSAQPARASFVPGERPPSGPAEAAVGVPAPDRRLTAAAEAIQDLYFLTTPNDAVAFAVKLLGELIPSEAICGCLYEAETDELRFVAGVGGGAQARRGNTIPASLGLFAIASRCGDDSLVVRAAARDPRFNPMVDACRGVTADNVLYLPLARGDRLLGMLQLINPASGEIGPSDLEAGTYIASQVSDFLLAKGRA